MWKLIIGVIVIFFVIPFIFEFIGFILPVVAVIVLIVVIKNAMEKSKLNARVEELRALAERGDAQAQYDLASTIWKQKNYSRSEQLEWYKKAAAQGHTKAQEAIEDMERSDREAEERASAPRKLGPDDTVYFTCNNCRNDNISTTVKKMGMLGYVYCDKCGSKDVSIKPESARHFSN